MRIRSSICNTYLVPIILIAGVGCQHTDSPGVVRSDAWPLPGQAKTGPSQETTSLQFAFARSLEAKGEQARAVAVYEELLSNANHADAHWRLGLIQSKQGQLAEASAHFRAAIEQCPNDPNLYCDLGYALYLQRLWADSEANLRKAITIAPGHQRSHMNLGLLLVRTQRADEAEQQFLAGGCSAEVSRSNVALAQSFQPATDFLTERNLTLVTDATTPSSSSSKVVSNAELISDPIREIPRLSWDAPNSAAIAPARFEANESESRFALARR